MGSYGDVFQCLVLSLGSSFLPAFGFVTGCISCKQTQCTSPAVRPAVPEEPQSRQSCCLAPASRHPASSLTPHRVCLGSGLLCPCPGKDGDSPLEGNASSPAIQCTAPTPAWEMAASPGVCRPLSFHLHRAVSAQLGLALENRPSTWVGRNLSTTTLLKRRNLRLGQHAGPWAGCRAQKSPIPFARPVWLSSPRAAGGRWPRGRDEHRGSSRDGDGWGAKTGQGSAWGTRVGRRSHGDSFARGHGSACAQSRL